MRFLLSIHDVWPGNFPQVAGYLARLRTLGARRFALLVVPAYHGRPPMDGSAEFISWLREESAAGTELFLHGYHHLMIESVEGAPYRGRRSAYGRWVNRRLVGGEAEFCGLPSEDIVRLLDLGLASWARAGIPLAGFVAPTWHGTPPRGLMRERGVPLCETRFQVERLSDGRTRFAPPLAWDLSQAGRGPVLVGGEPWLRTLTKLPLIKVAIHPGDLDSGAGPGAHERHKPHKPLGPMNALETVFASGENIKYGDLFGPDAYRSPDNLGQGNLNATSGART